MRHVQPRLASLGGGIAALSVLLAATSPGATKANPPARIAGTHAHVTRHRFYAVMPSPCPTNYTGAGLEFVGVTGGTNVAGGYGTAVLGGDENDACDRESAVGAGSNNTIGTGDADYSFIAAGDNNSIVNEQSFIGAGFTNQTNGNGSFLGAGYLGLAQGEGAFVGAGGYEYSLQSSSAAGRGNLADGVDSFVGAGDINLVGSGANGSAIGAGGSSSAAADQSSLILTDDSFVGAGDQNTIDVGNNAFIGSGSENQIDAGDDAIMAGTLNLANYGSAFVGAGYGNQGSGGDSFVGAGGGEYSKGPGQYYNNAVSGLDAFIGAGDLNQATGNGSFIGAGGYTSAAAGSGNRNGVSGTDSFLGAGDANTVAASGAFLGAGNGNDITSAGTGATLGGGNDNYVSGEYAALAGGSGNKAEGAFAMVPGGADNEALGAASFAAGYHAEAAHNGSFVWSDDVSGSSLVSDGAANEFVVRASGGTYFFSNEDESVGVKLAAGSGSWSSTSDRNVKTDVVPLDDAAILAKLDTVPVDAWRYKTERGVRHVGPMAQDFYAAFGAGEDNRHITSIDEDGVAFAAIKALHRENSARHSELTTMRGELAHLAAILAPAPRPTGARKGR